MKQKKNQIVINLLRLPNNQYQVIDQEQEDAKSALQSQNSSKKGAKNSQIKSAQPPLSPDSSNTNVIANTATQQPNQQNSQNIQSQTSSQVPQVNSQQNNSQMTQAQGGQTQQTALIQSSSQIPPAQPQASQVQQPPKANPTIIPNAAPPSVIMRGEENSKDIFPYTGFAQEKHNQQKNMNGAQIQGEKNKEEKQQKKYQVILPSCSHWFDLEKIHQIEKESLPEFFQGKPSKTPEIYKKENPRVYLTATACRRNLAGDVCAILRVHAFLEHWGIINFNCDPKLTPQSILLSKPSQANQSIYQYTSQSKKLDLLDQDRDLFNEGGEGDLVFNSIKLLSKNQRPICDFCGVICGLVWFQQKQTQENLPCMVLCIKCYTEGNYPSFLSDKDFEKQDLISKLSNTDPNKGTAKKSWTPEETHKLLEKIEEHKENWEEIMKYIEGRSREEIILHFLRLPLKNISQVRLFENEEDKSQGRFPYEQVADDEPTIFSDYSNPLIQHISIFKSLLDKHKQKKGSIKSTPKLNTKQKVEQKEENIEGTNNEIKEEEQNEEQKQQSQKNDNEMEVEETPAVNGQSKLEGVNGDEDLNKDEITQVENKKEDKKLGLINEVGDQNTDDLFEIEKMTKERAKYLQEREENKIKKLVQSLIYCQLNKLESKLNYLEEYEKLIWYERNQLEVTFSNHIAETVSLAYRRNEFNKEFTRNYQEQHKKNQMIQQGQVPPGMPSPHHSQNSQQFNQSVPSQHPNQAPQNFSQQSNPGGSQQNISHPPNQGYHKPPQGYPQQGQQVQHSSQPQQGQAPPPQHQNYQHPPQGSQNQPHHYGGNQPKPGQETTPTNSNPHQQGQPQNPAHQGPPMTQQQQPQRESSQSHLGGSQHNMGNPVQQQIPHQGSSQSQGQYENNQNMNVEEQNYYTQNNQQEQVAPPQMSDYQGQNEQMTDYNQQGDQGYQQEYNQHDQQMYDQNEKIDE